MQETAEQYRTRMFALTEKHDPMRLLAAAPAKLARLLRGVGTAKARKRPAPGKWSIAEIAAHMADTEWVIGYRLRAILGAPGGPIAAFDQDAWAAAMRYGTRDLRKSAEQFRALRSFNLALLKTLSPAAWKLHGVHSERGQQTLTTIARMTAGHDLNHLAQIERILGARK